MQRYFKSLLVIIIFWPFQLCAQGINNKSDLIGTWILNKISTPEGVSFELGNPERSIQFRFKMIAEILESLPELVEEFSSLDSIRNREHALFIYKATEQMRYTFTLDSVYQTFYYTSEAITIPGIYIFEKEEQKISCEFNYHTVYAAPVMLPKVILIQDNKLIIKDEKLDKEGKLENFSSIQEFVKIKNEKKNQ